MCGRLVAGNLTQAEMLAIIEGYIYPSRKLRHDAEAGPAAHGFNVAPTQQIDMLFAAGDDLVASSARWWFVPGWFEGPPEAWKATTFNAKLETAHEKPTFRDAWKRGRCLIPAMGYYEWSGKGAAKRPNYIRTAQNSPLMLLAGLHSRLAGGLRTCTILTRAALPEIAGLHDRMPVILSGENALRWLDHSDPDSKVIASYGTEWEGCMQAHPVARFGRDDDGPELIEAEPFLL